MALVPATVTKGTGAAVSSQATASVTLSSGTLYFLWVWSSIASAGNVPTVSGWTAVLSIQTATKNQTLVLFIKDGNGSTGTQTMDWAAQSQTEIAWSLDAWTGAAVAASAVVQSKGTANASSETLTSSLSSASNATYVGVFSGGGGGTVTPKAGPPAYTSITKNTGNNQNGTAYLIGPDNTDPPSPSIAIQFGPTSMIVAIELAAAGGGGATAWGPQLADKINRLVVQ